MRELFSFVLFCFTLCLYDGVKNFPFFRILLGETGRRKDLLGTQGYFITDVVQNCWCMMIIKTDLFLVRFPIVFKFSADNVTPLLPALGWLTPPNLPTICHCLFNARRGSGPQYHVSRLLEQAGLHLLYNTGESKGHTYNKMAQYR